MFMELPVDWIMMKHYSDQVGGIFVLLPLGEDRDMVTLGPCWRHRSEAFISNKKHGKL